MYVVLIFSLGRGPGTLRSSPVLKMTMCWRTLGLNFSALRCHDRTRQHQGKRLLYMLKVALFCAKSLLQKKKNNNLYF